MPKPIRLSLRTAALCAALAGLLPLPAAATLGGNEASIEADRAAMAATAGATQAGAGYTSRSYTLPSGTVVREFLGSAGTVFGVAWEGPQLPDLRQLLGERHFATMDDSARSRNREGRRGPVQFRPDGGTGMVFESTGHMRAFAGRAYLNDQLPAGVDANAIR